MLRTRQQSSRGAFDRISTTRLVTPCADPKYLHIQPNSSQMPLHLSISLLPPLSFHYLSTDVVTNNAPESNAIPLSCVWDVTPPFTLSAH